ncbi:MAG: zinc metallopeptidase [Gemmatales bacterium]
MLDDLQFLYLIVPALLFSAWASWRVKVNFAAGQQVTARCGLTGAEAAERMLKEAGVIAQIVETEGTLSDHYDPRDKVLRLSGEVYSGKSLAAIGVAAHEAGHAIQDGLNYPLLKLRNLAVPLASFGSSTGMLIVLAGLSMVSVEQVLGKWVLLAGIGIFSLTVIFQLLNLPVEFDATRRGRENLIKAGLVAEDEDKVVGKVLEAAALTYVGATLTSMAQLAYFILKALNPPKKSSRGGRSRRRQ